ncbi:hypothetical protein [Lachnobacterium bovis]|uniref:Flp pilus assembly protein TadB n=1 Tax=Lachnobacterium bovis TaxID=140626 RepID=A0A1H9RYC3_9FIRM|nr:hypothetical protein [Lachnobacterium bovis]SER77796.1 hypothetical protein SAMN02910429_01044 [Lachnobacterium bovis]
MFYKKIQNKLKGINQSISKKCFYTSYIVAFSLIFLLHLLLKLQLPFMGIMILMIIPMLYGYIVEHHKMKNERNRFEDVARYIETILYSFEQNGKIKDSLNAVYDSFNDGKMKKTIQKANNHLTSTFDSSNVMEGALKIIEKEYESNQLKDVHDFMLNVEKNGGKIDKPIELLLNKKSMWEYRINEMIQDNTRKFKEVVMSVITSLLICSMVLYIPTANVDISKSVVVQALSVLVFLIDLLIIKKAQKFLSIDWLKLDILNNDEYYIKKINEYKKNKTNRISLVSVIIGSLFLILAVVAFILKNQWLGVVMFLLSIFGYNQELVGRRIQKNVLIKEIKRAFPIWLMDLVLLLQNENVQMALKKSKENIPGILREEVEILIDKIEMSPESPKPYHDFLAEFDIAEIKTAMSMLYSLSNGDGASADEQIKKIIEKNQKMLNKTEKIRFSDLNSKLYLLFLAPVLSASLKLVVDMAVFMVTFLTSTRIGG